MGNGIAHVAARSGLKVVLHDLEQSLLDRALATIEKNLDREVAKSKISADVKSAAMSRIVATTKMSALVEADFVIEAVIEMAEDFAKDQGDEKENKADGADGEKYGEGRNLGEPDRH